MTAGQLSSEAETSMLTRLQEIYQRHRARLTEQVEDLERAATAALLGDLGPDAVDHARRQAHKLAGSAGMFGFPRASELGRELEHEFENFVAGSDGVRRLADLAVALREVLDQEPQRHESPPPATVDRPVILLLDQDEDFASQLVVEAAASGISVEIASTADEARDLAKSGPDAALLNLGDMTGSGEVFALLEELGEKDPPVPSLILTAMNSFTDRVEVARHGGRGFLQKPLLAGQVLEAVDQLLDRLRLESMTVLAVDDDVLVLDAIEVLLGARDITVTTLGDPSLFWETLEQVCPDLLLLDVDMPDVNGIELCKVVRNDPRWSELPIVFLTANTHASTVSAIFQSGADDFVAKPIVGPEILMRITNRLERLRLHRRLVETDPLTGTANRRKAIDVMDRLVRLSERYGQPVSIAIVDIDRFKVINDSYGHLIGDRVLRDLAVVLLQAFRGEDVVARWGGGEFFIGMYGMRCSDGVSRVAEVLESFRSVSFAGSDETPFSVTFSAGVAEFGVDGLNLQDLVRSADAAVFAAKESGRDRVVDAQFARDTETSSQVDIVLVEDDEALAPLLMHAFETRGLRARWIATGDGAVAQLCSVSPAMRTRVVILDWDLPGLNGPAVLRTLVENGNLEQTNVVMLTGRTTEAEVLSTLEIGAADHIAKPFSVPVLMQRIRRFLER